MEGIFHYKKLLLSRYKMKFNTLEKEIFLDDIFAVLIFIIHVLIFIHVRIKF